jgi:methionyl-tRNA formyltransferase
MRIIYMGTPEFARWPLVHLCESRHQMLAVVTGPDKLAGRGHKLNQTPVKQEALARGIPVLTPSLLKDDRLAESLRQLSPDLFVIIAFRILPTRLFTIPRLGSINIHGSLLPKYRGAAPINWALINGEVETGLSSFFLKREVDTGNVIMQVTTAIADDDTYDSLASKMSRMAGPFLMETLDAIEAGRADGIPQDDALATAAPKLTPFNSMIDWGFPSVHLRNFVRGLCSKPGAYSYFRGKRIKILGCAVADEAAQSGIRPGTVLQDKRRLMVACGPGAVEITRIVPEGKAEMTGAAFVNGFKPLTEEVFGEIPQGIKEFE